MRLVDRLLHVALLLRNVDRGVRVELRRFFVYDFQVGRHVDFVTVNRDEA